jgi:photosystem II stability/assembly factor-like uncharacterized protein
MKKLYTAFILVFIFSITHAQTTWTVLSEPRTSNVFKASSFINDNEGWLIDNTSVLWHTSDACVTLDTLSTGKYFLKLDFISSSIGYAVDASKVYKTTNGGV